MRKNYLMKIFVMLGLLITSQKGFSQNYLYHNVPTAAGGTSGAGRAPVTNALAHRSCAIYPATEFSGLFTAGDTIFRVGYILNTPIATSVSGTFTLFMVNTSDATFQKNTLWDSIITSRGVMDTVYSGPMTIPTVAGAYYVTLTKPFVYSGGGVYFAYQWQPTAAAATAAVYVCNPTLAASQRNIQGASIAALTSLTGSSAFRPQLSLGKKMPTNDAQVLEVYSLGKRPIPFANPYGVRARVKNLGSDTLLNKAFYVSISPNNAFLDSVIVDTLYPSQERTIQFNGNSSMFTGTDTVMVFGGPDNNNSNNSRIYGQIVNLNTYNYADPFKPANGGVGFTGATGDFVAKFPYSGSNSINQVGVNFNTGGTTLKVAIWDTSATGTPGTVLWESAPFVTATGLNTIPVNPPIPISGTFFVGVRQTGTVNAAFSFQAETPIRSQTFYYTSPTGNTAWTDFLTTNSNFRFMIEPRLSLANDLGATEITYPCQAFPLGQNISGSSAEVFNYGSNVQTGVKVRIQIRNAANALVYNDSANISAIGPNTAAQITFGGTFNPTVAGVYTVKAWSELGTDGDRNNDTSFKTITVQAPLAGNTSGTRIQFDGNDDFISFPKTAAVLPGTNFTIESWLRISNAIGNTAIYSIDSSLSDTSLSINASGLTPQIIMKTSNGTLIASANQNLALSSWTHLAVTYDGSNVKMYINGSLAMDTVFTGTPVTNGKNIYLGRKAGLGSGYSGGMENYRFWDTALSQNTIELNMHRKLAPMSSANLHQEFRFDEGIGNSILADNSGNCQSGFMNNFDVTNTAVATWFLSSLPLDTLLPTIQTITSSAPVSFANKNLSLSFQNFNGTTQVAAHYFKEPALGFQPDTILNTAGKRAHNRYWILYNFSNTATYDSVLATFTTPAGNIGTAALDSMYLASRESGASGLWTLARNPADTINLTTQSVRFWLPATNTFSRQYGLVSSTPTNPLPVKYAWFKGEVIQKDAQLNWATASEINNSHFIIERSVDGIYFERMGQVKGNGNSQRISHYNFTDAGAFGLSYSNLYYRLVQVDFDGAEEISETIVLSLREEELEVKTIQPNPFNQDFSVKFVLAEDMAMKMVLVDINGKELVQREVALEKGLHHFYLDEAGGLPGGIYFLRLEYHGKSQTFKLVKLGN